MSSTALSGSCQRIAAKSLILPLLYPSLLNVRSASLNSAIGRGLRKSKGVGFRGREKPQHDSSNTSRESGSSFTRVSDSAGGNSGHSRDGWRGDSQLSGKRDREKPHTGRDVRIRAGKREIQDDRIPVRRSRAARFNDPNSSFGKRSTVGQERKGLNTPTEPVRKQDWRDHKKFDRGGDPKGTPGGFNEIGMRNRWDSNETKVNSSREHWGAGSGPVSSSIRSKYRSNSDDQPFSISKRETDRRGPAPSFRSSRDKQPFSIRKQVESDRRNPTLTPHGNESDAAAAEALPTKVKFTQSIMDKRMPVTIPYTTPASEFLYGTSVVEAALNSRSVPRRKLYKFYIYRGPNRENADQDRALAKLARNQGVPVEFVSEDWLRKMDKMSAGRPHNGYILEASPLPRLPVLSLGEVSSSDDKPGFKLVLDHQSREEAAVNGSADFVPMEPLARSGDSRKPFVLLLDSILDPGNLGGIIRTAAFLGVTAIAISSRNSAGFSPVVLKASAGACENVRLFTVNKPAGFITDSQAAGWKIYAAVAPTTNRSPNAPISLTTEELYNPLQEAPCILMLGSEGAGLRWNLRSKADVELSIEGSGQRGAVDSMNVSVATGVLCNAFLSKNARTTPPAKPVETREVRDLF